MPHLKSKQRHNRSSSTQKSEVGQKIEIQKLDNKVNGFNIGVNIGKEAGQSIMHCHVHLIPRRKGDVDDPRGGVRGVIPSKQKYERK